ncbi:MAG: glycosyltransferase 87 family protein [Solirubrobacteraceae bacterium]
MATTSYVPRARAGVAPIAAQGAACGLVLAAFALAAGAAAHPLQLVPASRGGTPGWLTGPLRGLGVGSSSASFQLLLLAMCALYVTVLVLHEHLGARALWGAIVLAHAAFLLGPPLLSADVFGYLDFARLGALHGLDPYTHTALSAPHDAVFPFLGWHDVRSPYGPLWTLLSYALVPLGLPTGLWALKMIAVLSSLGCAALIWRCAAAAGCSPRAATALYALNPLVLVFAVGGAHNETLLELLVAAGVALLLAGSERAAAGALVAAVAVKASAGLALPFALLGAHRRRAFMLAVAGALVVAALVGIAGFGAHGGTFVSALRGQQRYIALHSVPSEVSRALGLGRLAAGVRALFAAALVVAVGASLLVAWRARGRWLDALGWSTIALLVCTAWLLPWYGAWALVPAALSRERRLRWSAVALSFYLVATRLAALDPLLG